VRPPVSAVLPCLDDRELLAANLPVLLDQLDAERGDEAIVVDDVGDGALADWVEREHPRARAVARDANGGFAAALTTGVESARNELVLSLNPDVRVRAGFLAPLVAHMADESVFAAAPLVLLDGEAPAAESLSHLVLEDGMPVVRRARDPREGAGSAAQRVAFALGGACLLRRRELLELGFDPVFEPFYWEDVDLCWRAWRAGRRVLVEPASVVEHHHRGTIGRRVPERLVRAAIEKNRLLFAWKHLDSAADIERHLAALGARLVEHAAAEEREELVRIVLALEQLEQVAAARAALPAPRLRFDEIQRALEEPDTGGP